MTSRKSLSPRKYSPRKSTRSELSNLNLISGRKKSAAITDSINVNTIDSDMLLTVREEKNRYANQNLMDLLPHLIL